MKNPPLSVRFHRCDAALVHGPHDREIMHLTAPERLYLSEDFQEAARAFTVEKRKPAKLSRDAKAAASSRHVAQAARAGS